MKTQKVWVLPDNNTASSPIAWVDPDNPTFQNSQKGDFIPCEAKILNEGRAFFFSDEDDTADVPYETKTIILEKLMPIKGCKTNVETEVSTTGTEPNLTTKITIKKSKNPQAYVFLKKPTFSGGSGKTTETQDLQFTDMANWDIQIFFDCDYSAHSPVVSSGRPSPFRLCFKTPDGRLNYFAEVTKTASSAADAWNGRKLSPERPATNSGTTDLEKTTAVDNKVTSAFALDLDSSFWARFYNTNPQTNPVFYNGYIPQGTKICIVPSYYYYKASTGQMIITYMDPIELGYVNTESCVVHVDTWLELDRNLPEGITSGDIIHATLTEPASGLTTLNTPCWTFLNDIRRVNKGGKMVMKGTIRYLSYMADLQPEGDDYRDFEPYEIGE